MATDCKQGNLIISRNEGESFSIGDEIEITVVEVRRGGCIRLGVRAPKHLPILRDNIRDERKAVAS